MDSHRTGAGAGVTFIGSINADLRSIVSRYAVEWRGDSVYVGCSGNFTVERILAKAGAAELHGNDVSLYSCTVGRYLAGESFTPLVADEDWTWLELYLSPGPSAIATLLLCTVMLEGLDRQEAFFVRRRQAYRDQWERLHGETVKRVEKALDGVRLRSFCAGDVVDFLAQAPADAAFLSFPPTYAKGYERLYAAFDRVFTWDPPSYEVFDKARLGVLVELMLQRERWLFARDEPVEQLQEYQVGQVQTAIRSKPLYIYSRSGRPVLTAPIQQTEQVLASRLEESSEITGSSRVAVAPLSQPQFNLLRSEYLNPGIAPAAAQLRLAVLVDSQLIGSMAFNRPQWGGSDVYLLSDFAIRPTPYPRLSKLVLAATLSTEVQQLIECSLASRAKLISTTAFTDRPASAKYRGLFTLQSRKPGRLHYIGTAGRWSLQEGLAWWLKHHSSTTSTDD